MSKSAQLETAQGFFDDLLTMEINVILKPGMTARKMPNTMEAFQDIAKDYARYLRVARGDIDRGSRAHRVRLADTPLPAEGELPRAPKETGDVLTPDLFGKIADHAADLHAAGGTLYAADVPDEGRGAILSRIERNSRILQSIMPVDSQELVGPLAYPVFSSDRKAVDKSEKSRRAARDRSGAAPPPTRTAAAENQVLVFLSKERLITLRKAWEVGTESVVMQTTAQVDGDIVTRIQEDKASAEHAPLQDVHLHLVGESLQHWRFLFATVASFTLGVFESFFGQRG